MDKDDFIKMLEQARELAKSDEGLREVLSQFDEVDEEAFEPSDETRFKIPYVSASAVVDHPWQ